jgi:hypothetical protein
MNATILDGQGVLMITNDDCLTAPTIVYVDDSYLHGCPEPILMPAVRRPTSVAMRL